LGFLPGSGARDLGGQIQFLGFIDDASKLLRWKLSAAMVATTPSNKVVAVCCFFLLTVLSLLCLPLAGLGAEGMEMDWAWRCGLGGGGSLSAPAHVRGAGQGGVSSASSADLLPAGRGGVGLERLRRWRSCNSLFERGLCSSGCPQQVPFCLTGRGGEEVKAGELVAAGLGGGSLELLEIWLHVALPLRWRAAAIAISGHKVGRAALDAMVGASFFVLCVRIFCSNSAASRSPTKPSGLVPGLDWGGAALSLQAAGGRLGLVCVLAVLSRVFVVKVQGHVVILLFLQGLSVIRHPPLE
jgi:hypothetical protein